MMRLGLRFLEEAYSGWNFGWTESTSVCQVLAYQDGVWHCLKRKLYY